MFYNGFIYEYVKCLKHPHPDSFLCLDVSLFSQAETICFTSFNKADGKLYKSLLYTLLVPQAEAQCAQGLTVG